MSVAKGDVMGMLDYVMMAFFAISLLASFCFLPSGSVESQDGDEDYQWWAIR